MSSRDVLRPLLVTICALIFTLGVVMVFNTSAAQVLDRSLQVSTHLAVVRHILFALLGIGLACFVYFLKLETLFKLALPGLIGVSILLALVFLPGIGLSLNGAHRWVRFAGQTLQPSEMAKIVVPIYLVGQFGQGGVSFWRMCRILAVAGIPIVLILLEPDNGTVLIFLSLIAVTLFVTRVKFHYWLIPMVVVGCATVSFALTSDYVVGRLKVYMNPELDLLGRGHQPYQAKIAAGSGGMLGTGLGHSMQKLSYLPEAQNDYIAAIYAEEFGFVGITALLALYAGLVVVSLGIAAQARAERERCLAAVLAFLLAIQAFFNLGVVSGVMPSTGLNLPFFSQGGTSLMCNLIVIGMLASVRQKDMHHSRRNRRTPLSSRGVS